MRQLLGSEAARLLSGPSLARGAELIAGLDATAISAYAALLTASGTFLVGLAKLLTILLARKKNLPIEAEELAWLREEIQRAHQHHDDEDKDE